MYFLNAQFYYAFLSHFLLLYHLKPDDVYIRTCNTSSTIVSKLCILKNTYFFCCCFFKNLNYLTLSTFSHSLFMGHFCQVMLGNTLLACPLRVRVIQITTANLHGKFRLTSVPNYEAMCGATKCLFNCRVRSLCFMCDLCYKSRKKLPNNDRGDHYAAEDRSIKCIHYCNCMTVCA